MPFWLKLDTKDSSFVFHNSFAVEASSRIHILLPPLGLQLFTTAAAAPQLAVVFLASAADAAGDGSPIVTLGI